MRVCLVSEGGYPIARGGLSEWAHRLLSKLGALDFDIFCISGKGDEKPVYDPLPNTGRYVIRPLVEVTRQQPSSPPRSAVKALVKNLRANLEGEALEVETLLSLRDKSGMGKGWLLSKDYWNFLADYYGSANTDGSFTDYFWAVFGIHTILFDVIKSVDYIPRADAYHALSTGFAGFSGAMAKLLYRKPLVLTEQGLYLKERFMELERLNSSTWYRKQFMNFVTSIVKTSFRYADRVALPCRSHIAVEQEMGLDVSRVDIINNGIECDKYVPGPDRNGAKPVIGCFARVVPVKGLEVLIRAAKILSESSSADFVVVGEIQDRQYHSECLRLVAELGLSDCFRFVGHRDSLEWYHKVDIFTLSSHSEGVPYALLEAMSCGLPSVCTAVGGVPEIITEGVGYLVPPNSPGELADRLRRLIADRELRLSMAKIARREALAKYSLSDMAMNFRRLYEELSLKYDGARVLKA